MNHDLKPTINGSYSTTYSAMPKSRVLTTLSKTVAILLLFWFLLEVPYFALHIPFCGAIQLAVLSVACIEVLALAHRGNREISLDYVLLITLIVFQLISTYLNSADLTSALSQLVPIVVFCFYIHVATWYELLDAMKIWAMGLFVLLVLDLTSMVVFPNGMYNTVHVNGVYSNNWILGYKTRRLLFTIPLVVFLAIRQSSIYGRVKPSFFIVSVMVVVNAWWSDGSGALISVFYFALCVTLVLSRVTIFKKIGHILIDYRVILGIVIVSFVLLIVIGQHAFFTRVATDYLMKSSTFSGRTRIWQACMSAFSQSPVIGLGILDSASFELLSFGNVNAHNQILQILVNGGVIGAGLYALLYLRRMINADESIGDRIAMAAISSMLIAGIFSAVFTFTVAFFMMFFLIGKRFNQSHSSNESWIEDSVSPKERKGGING